MNYVLITAAGWLRLLALVCCTYAPLNHEMQSNLRSSNGKYCVRTTHTTTHTPLHSHTLKDRPGGSCQCASVCQLELTASASYPSAHRPSATFIVYNSILSFRFWIFEIARTWNSSTAAQRASRVNEKDTHVNFNFGFGLFIFSLSLALSCSPLFFVPARCSPQGLLKLVASGP